MTTNNLSSIFIDSSAWISYTIEPDSNHAKAAQIFESYRPDTKIFISLFILDETISKLRKVIGQEKAKLFYLNIKALEKNKKIEILEVGHEEVEKAIFLLDKYPTPNTFSLTDATNIVLCKKHRIKTLFSFDSDFRKITIPHLRIVP